MSDTPELAVVRYSTDDTAGHIIHDRLRCGELCVAITRRIAGRDGPAVERESLDDIIAVDHDLASVGVRTFMVRPDDTALLRHCVGRLAQWTRRYATPVIDVPADATTTSTRRTGRPDERCAASSDAS